MLLNNSTFNNIVDGAWSFEQKTCVLCYFWKTSKDF